MKYLDLTLKPLMNHKVVLALFGIIGSSISPPGRISELYSENRFFRFLYFFIGCYVILDYNVVSTLLCVFFVLIFYDLMRKGRDDSYKPFFGDMFQHNIN